MLEHPGIVPVYGLGRNGDDRPYYAMRLIRPGDADDGASLGRAIADYHEAGGPASDPSPGLRELLGRFVAACNAVAYTCIAAASCTAISSRRTSCWAPMARPSWSRGPRQGRRSASGDWPADERGSRPRPGGSRSGRCRGGRSEPPHTRAPSRRAGISRSWALPATSTAWAHLVSPVGRGGLRPPMARSGPSR